MSEQKIERRLTYQYGVNSNQRISGFESFEDLHQRVRRETMGEVNIVRREQRTVITTDWTEGEAPEQDTLDRALWRVDAVLAALYDGETEEPVQALGDLMTDILHWCDYHERSLSGAEDRATQMVEWERADWGLPRIWSSDRMFRRTGPLVRQRRSER